MSRFSKDKFNFFIETELHKGKNDSGENVVYIDGIASSISQDSDGEYLSPTGFNLRPLLERGLINFNHQGSKDSNANIGIPLEAKVINDGRDLYFKGMLWDCPQTQGILRAYENFKKYSPNRKIGYSIEGTATLRGSMDKNSSGYKQILQADVTGMAVTFSAKNPNTLMNIIKGDYSEPFINEDDSYEDEEPQNTTCKRCGKVNTKENKCSCIVKDMTTESIEPATPESVEHDPKKISNNITKKFGNVINKSEIYISILNKYNSQIAETKKIYSLVEKTNQNLFSMTNTISDEAIQKSFDLLDEAIALTKSKETEALVPDKKEDVASEEDLKKSKDIAEFLINKAGMSKEDACDHLVKGGFTLAVAQGAAESVIAEMNAKKQGGDITATGDPIVKSEEVSVLISEEIKKSFAPITDTISKGFEGVNDIVKALREQNNELIKSNDSLNERLDKFESGSQGRKSITTASAIDRFEKGNDSTELKKGEEIINIGSKKDLARLVSRLDAENATMISKGLEADPLYIRAIEQIEICNVVPEESYPRLRSIGIILQKD